MFIISLIITPVEKSSWRDVTYTSYFFFFFFDNGALANILQQRANIVCVVVLHSNKTSYEYVTCATKQNETACVNTLVTSHQTVFITLKLQGGYRYS